MITPQAHSKGIAPRVNGHMHLRALRDTLERITQPVGATGHTDTVSAA